MFSERQTAMMATLVSGCVWKRLFSFFVLDSVFFAMGARNGMFEILIVFACMLYIYLCVFVGPSDQFWVHTLASTC